VGSFPHLHHIQIYKVMSLTYWICFIYLPISVTGPEGPSMCLVLSWELAFYEISVASQKSVILVFLEWFTFLVFYCLFFTVLLWTFIGVKIRIMMCGLASSGDMMNFLVESGTSNLEKMPQYLSWHGLPIAKLHLHFALRQPIYHEATMPLNFYLLTDMTHIC